MASTKDPFAPALHAEIEAVVARYEALARAHQEALAVAREQELNKLRQDLATLLADRERCRTQEAEARSQLKAQTERATLLDRDLTQTRQQLADALRRSEALQGEARTAADSERKEHAKAQAALQAQLDDARRQLELARAEATRRLAQVEGALREVKQEAETLSEAFAAERAFVEATQGLDGSMLLDALRAALGADLNAAPGTYATIKARRPDALLTHALKERGRSVVTAPLSDRERASLPALAAAAGCELISPEHGARFSPSAMDKAMTQADPAEEGNVLDCLLPGLRLAGTDGAMVFPRVLVATG